MSNKNNTSLNDLFRSAQAEAEQDVLSQSEVERLLQTSRRSVPVTQTIGQKLFERLLSTPLKIGMTAMTTAACITLGLIAFWPTPQQSATNFTKAPILSHRTYASQGTVETAQNISQPTANNATFAVANKQAVVATAIIPATPIATADSLQPIELTPEQLAQLGIVLEDNGDIDFYTKSSANGEINKFGLPPSWGIKMHFWDNISDSELTGIHILKMAPRLVTEPDGAKRLFSFESDSTFSKTDSKGTTTANMRYEMKILPPGYDSIHQNPNDERILVHVSNDSSHFGGAYINLDIDSTFKRLDAAKKWNGSVRVNINNDSNNIQRLVRAVDVLNHSDSDIHKMELTIDELHDKDAGSDIDAEMIAANESHDKALKLFKDLGYALINKTSSNADSIDLASNLNIDALINSPINLDRLIPIRVVNLKNAEHPNELIFWYEPSPELTAAMPAAVNATPAPQSKQLAISVYPNPTYGPATIHYELSDAPRAYFSVRNLLGQEVLNGGMTSGTTGDASLDLSQLPAGVYLLITTTDNGERDVERVVVTK
jgi:hypothetical protein